MSLIKLALDNSYDPSHKNYRGLKTKEVWAGRGIGALAGSAIGGIAGGGEGALAGALIGLVAGDLGASTRRVYHIAKHQDKYKRPIARTLFGQQAYLDMVQHTPADSAIKQLDFGTAAGGAILRHLNEK